MKRCGNTYLPAKISHLTTEMRFLNVRVVIIQNMNNKKLMKRWFHFRYINPIALIFYKIPWNIYVLSIALNLQFMSHAFTRRTTFFCCGNYGCSNTSLLSTPTNGTNTTFQTEKGKPPSPFQTPNPRWIFRLDFHIRINTPIPSITHTSIM